MTQWNYTTADLNDLRRITSVLIFACSLSVA